MKTNGTYWSAQAETQLQIKITNAILQGSLVTESYPLAKLANS